MNNEQKKDEIKMELIKMNYFKTPEGKQLYELSLGELEQVYANVKHCYENKEK
ncbi:Fur-regulated basic protein FbpA [Priestia flexa]|jgi:Fur-regulated basic protein A|uniref:Fur-regulated basic protein FbpA n=1 Tax=Priestia flexa TaxID=86664 RepID=UPI003D0739C4